MKMHLGALIALAFLLPVAAQADPPPAAAPPYRPGVSLQPVTLYDKDGNVIGSLGGGSVTAPGTSGSQAQAVQGINGGVPVGVSATSLPLPTGAATETTQQGVATSNAAINTATGTQADAATASGANTSIIGALRAIRDRLLATLTVSVGSSVLPTGAATAGNQATEIASLATIAQRAVMFADAVNQSITANTLFSGTLRDLGTAPAYTKFNLAIYASQTGTVQLVSCPDSACAVSFIVQSYQVAAGSFATVSAPVYSRYMRYTFQTGGTAGFINANTSFTAN